MEGEVFSVFWVVAAFVAGGFCGVLFVALVRLSVGSPKQSTGVLKEQLRGLDLGGGTVV